jgi:hypothetical protein
MSQKSSIPQDAKSVTLALTPDTGSIRSHCSSSSQNRLDRIRCSRLTAKNRQPILIATNLLGFDPSDIQNGFGLIKRRTTFSVMRETLLS